MKEKEQNNLMILQKLKKIKLKKIKFSLLLQEKQNWKKTLEKFKKC
jgi:hypothetical protein